MRRLAGSYVLQISILKTIGVSCIVLLHNLDTKIAKPPMTQVQLSEITNKVVTGELLPSTSDDYLNFNVKYKKHCAMMT